VVVLTQPLDYRKKPAKKWVFSTFMRRYPAIVEAMARRHEMYNAQLDFVHDRVAAGDAFVIAPPVKLPIGRVEMNPEKMKRVYSIGCDVCTSLLPRLQDFLGK